VLISTVMLMTVAMFGSKAWIDAKILQPTAAATAAAAAGVSSSGGKAPKKKKKSKGSFSEGLAVLKNSPKIRNLALLVMSYGVGHRSASCASAQNGSCLLGAGGIVCLYDGLTAQAAVACVRTGGQGKHKQDS
jgi:hypothetical protein